MFPEQQLARWAAGLRWEEIPSTVQGRVRSFLSDATASALLGSTTDLAARVRELPVEMGGTGGHPTVGGPEHSPVGAAFLNAYHMTAATICDVYRPALCHVGPETVPPLLSIAGRDESTVGDVLAALTVGLEVTARLGQAIDYPTFRARGWHSPGVLGPVGGAAAVARLAGLDEHGANMAMAHASSQAAGTFAALGTPGVKFHQASGAVSALLAGLVAERGLTTSDQWLSAADGGMLNVYTGGGFPERIVQDLGRHWELQEISLRRWPAASSMQGVIAAGIDLERSSERPLKEIRRIELAIGEEGYAIGGERRWGDPLSAQQSARWILARTLGTGGWWLDDFSEAAIRDSVTARFAEEAIHVEADPELPPGAITLRVNWKAGGEDARSYPVAKGDPQDPLSSADISGKFEQAVASARMLGFDPDPEPWLKLEHEQPIDPLLRSLSRV